jgi:hypothetical protein
MSEPSIARGMSPNRHSLDEDSASRLLQGVVHPDDAPPGYGAVAGLLSSAARLPRGPVDEDVAALTVSAMVEVIRDATPAPETRRKTMLGKLLAGKALAAIAVVGLTATGAAAATGSLPDAAQGVVSDAVGHVGIDIPHPNHGKSADHRKDGDHRKDKDENEAGDNQNGPGDNGPADPNNGQQTSDDAHTAKTEAKEAGEKVGPAVCAVVSDGKCQAGKDSAPSGTDDEGGEPADQPGKSGEEHGKPETTPATPDTPNGSIDTGAENSGRDLPSGKGKPDTNG